MRQPAFRDGQRQLLECTPGWDGNWTHDCFIVFGWQGVDDGRFVVAVNFAANQSQCHARLPFANFAGRQWGLQDQLAPLTYTWKATTW
jgi:hypothetical protein